MGKSHATKRHCLGQPQLEPLLQYAKTLCGEHSTHDGSSDIGDEETQTIHIAFMWAPLISVYCGNREHRTNRLHGKNADILYC